MNSPKESNKYAIKVYQTLGFSLTESAYPPKLRMPRHTHESASFSLVLQGAYTEKYEQSSRHCQCSTIVVHPPQESHSVDFLNTKSRILNIKINHQRYQQLCEHSKGLKQPKSLLNSETIYLTNRLQREFNQKDEISALAVEGLILEILAEVLRPNTHEKTFQPKSPRWMKEVEEFLHSNFAESFTLEEIAKIADVHSVHLARVFRERYGCTIGEYVRKLRVEFACRQIKKDIPISEIALSAGFSDQSHLTRTFKTQVGLTPNEYKKLSQMLVKS